MSGISVNEDGYITTIQKDLTTEIDSDTHSTTSSCSSLTHSLPDPIQRIISQTTSSNFYYPYDTTNMSRFEKYFRVGIHLVVMPFVQGIFVGIGEMVTRRLFQYGYPLYGSKVKASVKVSENNEILVQDKSFDIQSRNRLTC